MTNLMTKHRIILVLIIILAADTQVAVLYSTIPWMPLANLRCLLVNISLIYTFLIKVNTYRWLSAIRATCTTKSFSKGP